MKKVYIPIVLGTARTDRVSERVARYIVSVFQKHQEELNATCVFVDVRDYLFGKTTDDESIVGEWKALAEKADAFIIVSPEYNHSIPGELKILLDSLEEEYEAKPVSVVGVSSGSWGGVRMADALLPILITLGMVPVTPFLHVPVAHTVFDAQGNLVDLSYMTKIESYLRSFVTRARVNSLSRSNSEK